MGLIKEFKEFAIKGNMIDMAVGIIMGGAFGTVVSSLVNDIFMPPLGLLTSGVDFKDKKAVLQAADTVAGKAEIAMTWGKFINAGISFLMVALAVFMLVKMINTARKRFEEEKPAPAPAGPTKDQQLLMEIRDALRSR